VRNRSGVSDIRYAQTGRGQRADRALPARSRAIHANLHRAQTVIARGGRRFRRGLLRRERRAFARSPEAQRSGAGPGDHVALLIVLLKEAWTCTMPECTIFFSFFLNVFFFPALTGAFDMFSSYVLTLRSRPYVFATAFFLLATAPFRGPLRVRALVCVRWPRTGRLRRCR
jgi:hypothetical protein